MINLFIKSENCPSCFKIATVIPIYKKILQKWLIIVPSQLKSVFCTIIEKVVNIRVYDFLDKYRILFNSDYSETNHLNASVPQRSSVTFANVTFRKRYGFPSFWYFLLMAPQKKLQLTLILSLFQISNQYWIGLIPGVRETSL